MGSAMIIKTADNIISPLGLTTEDNLNSILCGRSELRLYSQLFGVHEAFCGSLIDRAFIDNLFDNKFKTGHNLTLFEKLCVLSASEAMTSANIDPSQRDVVFVISTTKGNVDLLNCDLKDSRCYIYNSARTISSFFRNPNAPIVVSNACISGVCGQIIAIRQLLSTRYATAIVIGADTLSKFIISGFQSFKALSQTPCKPYDQNRTGLNLGEAVGTIVLQTSCDTSLDSWQFKACSIHNDANHISGPSRIGEGAYRVLSDILPQIDSLDLAFISTHGTATIYNDEMESIAIHRAGLETTPITALKGFYGHTLGAAGVIETILAMTAIDHNTILATKGFDNQGTTYKLNISNQISTTDKKTFIKILSGFGGTNAGIAYSKGGSKQ